jgi:hypothetical protein
LQHPEMNKNGDPTHLTNSPTWACKAWMWPTCIQAVPGAYQCLWGAFKPGIRRDKSDLLYPFVGTTCLVCFNRESLSRSCSCFLRCWQGFCTALQNRSIQVSAIAKKSLAAKVIVSAYHSIANHLLTVPLDLVLLGQGAKEVLIFFDFNMKYCRINKHRKNWQTYMLHVCILEAGKR